MHSCTENTNYLLTGILLNRKDGVPCILELSREPGLRGSAQILITPAHEVMDRGNNPPGATMTVLNSHLKSRGVNIPKMLYRLGLVASNNIDYHIETLNCDVVAMWLTSGEPLWFNKTRDSDLAFLASDFVTSKGTITLSKLFDIENNVKQADLSLWLHLLEIFKTSI